MRMKPNCEMKAPLRVRPCSSSQPRGACAASRSRCGAGRRALNQFEAALYSPQFTSPTAGWRAFGNEKSFIDWFITAEVLKNTKHSYHGAVFMYKVRERPPPLSARKRGAGSGCTSSSHPSTIWKRSIPP